LKFAVLIILLFKWLLFYFILQRYGYKTSGTLLSGSKGVTQKLNYPFSKKYQGCTYRKVTVRDKLQGNVKASLRRRCEAQINLLKNSIYFAPIYTNVAVGGIPYCFLKAVEK
ncbi:hypothetical protein, partial [uncultured Bacteroides sp.]|uniref:hypothetical protein n=1 Tax=uncultured Bacteroides sp. TaxID=162156 RepID=UPI00258CF2EF